MRKAGPDAVFMHCQPAHRGVEVTSEVLDAPYSLVMKQAFNRMISSKGIFSNLIGDSADGFDDSNLAHHKHTISV
jgi:ornithine carbamoyltransferase